MFANLGQELKYRMSQTGFINVVTVNQDGSSSTEFDDVSVEVCAEGKFISGDSYFFENIIAPVIAGTFNMDAFKAEMAEEIEAPVDEEDFIKV